MKRVLSLAAIAAMALAPSSSRAARATVEARAARAGAVTSLSVVPADGRAEVVIGLDGPVQVQDFALRGPDKIVIDMTGASLGLPARGYDRVDRGGVVDVRWSQYRRNVVRVVITLDGTHEYEVSRGDGELRVRVKGAGSKDFTAWHAVAEAKQQGRAMAEKPVAEQPVAEKPAAESSRASETPREPKAAARRADREDEDNKPSPALRQQRSQQPRITTAFINTPIRDVISSFAAFSGRTIVVGKNVTGTVDAEISDQPWDVAMKAILDAHGFAATEDQNGIIVVDTYQNIAARVASEPLVTRTIRLNYARAAGVAENVYNRLTRDCGPSPVMGNTTPSGTQPAPTTVGGQVPAAGGGGDLRCPARGAVTADTLTNSVSLTDVPSNIAALEAYARSLDLRQPQVAIKAKIIFVDRTQLEALGLRYDLGYDPRTGPGQFFNRLIQRRDSTGQSMDPNTNQVLLGGNVLSGLANASATIPNAALQLVYSTALGNYSFSSFLEALQEVQLLDVQAEPSVVTLNNRLANLTAGTEVPVRVIEAATGGAGSGNFPRATVQFRKTGVILQVTPQITANRQIIMRVHAENSSVQFQSSDVGAVFPTQSVDNEVLVADGETAVMGGLTQTSVSVTKSGIPVLMDLPFLGKLFGVTTRNEVRRDLLVLITPHIVDEGETAPGVDIRR